MCSMPKPPYIIGLGFADLLNVSRTDTNRTFQTAK